MPSRFIVIILILSFSPWLHASEKEPLPAALLALVRELDSAQVKSINEAAPLLARLYGQGFTVTSQSQSRQGKNRLIAYGANGELIVGIGAEAPTIELVTDTGKHLASYELAFRPDPVTKKNYTLTRTIEKCADCHGESFHYIWGQYPKWPYFFGRHDDQQDPKDPQFQAIRKIARFKPFFDQKSSDPSFPYQFVAEEDRQLEHMANTRLSMIIGRRTARKLYRQLKQKDPALYRKYKYLLARLLLECPDLQDSFKNGLKETQALSADLKAGNPEVFREWSELPYFNVYGEQRERMLLELLHLLGVPPDQIILTRKWETNDPIASASEYKANFLDMFGSYGGSPMNYQIGDGLLRDFLLGLMFNDIDNPVFRTNTQLPKYGTLTKPSAKKLYYLPQSDKLDEIAVQAETSYYKQETTCNSLRAQSEAVLGRATPVIRDLQTLEDHGADGKVPR